MRDTEKRFMYKDRDIEGMATLEVISEANNFNEWMYHSISKNLSGKILEIGSGIGNISECIIKDNREIFLSDIRENYCGYLQDRFGHHPEVLGVLNLDLVHENFESLYAAQLGYFDAVFALNVVEHIENDTLAIANCKKLLKPGGTLVILVPAYPALYNTFDKALAHYRRYTKSSLTALLVKNEMRVKKSFYFNFAGITGWVFSGSILRKKIIPSGQMRLYNRLVPLFKIIDKIVFNSAGLSVIAEAEK